MKKIVLSPRAKERLWNLVTTDFLILLTDGEDGRRKAASRLVDDRGVTLCEKGAAITEALLNTIPHAYWGDIDCLTEDDEDEREQMDDLTELVAWLEKLPTTSKAVKG